MWPPSHTVYTVYIVQGGSTLQAFVTHDLAQKVRGFAEMLLFCYHGRFVAIVASEIPFFFKS